MLNKIHPQSSSFLLICLAGLLMSVAIFGAPPLWTSFQFTTRDACVGIMPPISPPLCLAGSFQGFSFLTVLYLLGNYFLTALFGYVLVRPFFFGTFTTPFLSFVASFFLGYTCLVGIIRVLSLFFPYNAIYWPVMATQLLLILLFVLRDKELLQWLRPVRSAVMAEGFLPKLLWAAGLLVFFLSVLLLQVRQDNFAWSGHGSNQYAYLLEQWRVHPPLHFSVLMRHYDELIFHYFLTMPLRPLFDPVLCWWITLAVIKTSLWVFLFLTFRKCGVSFFLSLVFALFLFIGTGSPLPTKYYMLFDSSNYLYFTVHAGRVVGIGAIFWLMADMLFSAPGRRLNFLTLLLVGVGLTATVVSNGLWLLLFGPWLAMTGIYFRSARPDGRAAMMGGELRSGTLLCYAAVTAALLLYGLPFAGKGVYAVRTSAVFLVAALFLLRAVSWAGNILSHPSRREEGKREVPRQAVLMGALLLGFTFLGNAFVDHAPGRLALRYLGRVAGETSIQALPISRGHELEKPQTGTFSIGDHREVRKWNEYYYQMGFTPAMARERGIGLWNEYCKGLAPFIAYYGLILFMILATNEMYRRGRKRAGLFSWQDHALYEAFLLGVTALPLFLFLIDFIDFGERAWYKSRFLECPVYVIMFGFLYFIHRVCSRKQKSIAAGLLIVYMFVPFAVTERPRQILYNLETLREAFK
jgi:hypothetical protein